MPNGRKYHRHEHEQAERGGQGPVHGVGETRRHPSGVHREKRMEDQPNRIGRDQERTR